MGKSVTEVLKAAIGAVEPTVYICVDGEGVAEDCKIALYCFKRERWRLRRAEALKFDALRPLYETIEKYDAPHSTEVVRVVARFQLLQDDEPVGDLVKALVARWLGRWT